MQIDMKKIAKLSMLQLTEAEEEQFAREMQEIVAMVSNLPELDDAEFPLELEDAMLLREDTVQPPFDREDVLKNAPQTAEGCFVVPKTVG